MDPHDLFGIHAEVAPVRRVLLLGTALVVLGEEGQLGEIGRVGDQRRVDTGLVVLPLVERRKVVDPLELQLRLLERRPLHLRPGPRLQIALVQPVDHGWPPQRSVRTACPARSRQSWMNRSLTCSSLNWPSSSMVMPSGRRMRWSRYWNTFFTPDPQ